MSFMIGFVLLFVGIVFVQSTPIVIPTDNMSSGLEGLETDFDQIRYAMAQILPPGQFKEFEQHLNQLISSAATGEITHDELEIKVASLLAQYFGAYTGSSF